MRYFAETNEGNGYTTYHRTLNGAFKALNRSSNRGASEGRIANRFGTCYAFEKIPDGIYVRSLPETIAKTEVLPADYQLRMVEVLCYRYSLPFSPTATWQRVD